MFAGKQPILFVGGKIFKVCYLTLDPRIFLKGIGFGSELDVFLWRSLIYVAKKPFVQLRPPQFATFRIEDVVGDGDFRYLDFLIQNGFKIHLGLDIDDFKYEFSHRLKQYMKRSKVELSPHAFSHFKRTATEETKLIYGKFSGGSLPEEQIRANFNRLKKFTTKSGLKFSPVLTYHYCQLGKSALPHLKKMGVRYLTFPFQTNVALNDALKRKWYRRPFGKLGLVCDRLPEDNHFLMLVSHSFPKGSYFEKGKMDVSISSLFDFLYGLRLYDKGKSFKQYKDAEERVMKAARYAYENPILCEHFHS